MIKISMENKKTMEQHKGIMNGEVKMGKVGGWKACYIKKNTKKRP